MAVGAGELAGGARGHQLVAGGALHLALLVLGERGHPADGLRADVGAAGELGPHGLIIGVGEQARRAVLHEQVGVVLRRLGRLRGVEHGREIVRRVLEDAPAEAHEVGDPVPVVQLVGDEGRHAVLAVRRLANLHELLEGRRHPEPGLLDEIAAGRPRDHGPRLPREAVGGALGILQGGLGARHEVLGVEVERRLVPVAHELVERRHPARPDPAAGVDEGHVEEVPRAAFGRQLEVGPLVVDGEGLGREVHLHPGLFFELRDVFLQVAVEDVLERGAVDGHAREGLGLAQHRRRPERDGRHRRRASRLLEERASSHLLLLGFGRCRKRYCSGTGDPVKERSRGKSRLQV